jgi:hypothetical protein
MEAIMNEKIFNLFLFFNGNHLYELGVSVHEMAGSDEQKIEFLKSSINTDYKTCKKTRIKQTQIPPGRSEINKDFIYAMGRSGEILGLFEEILTQYKGSNTPLFCITSIVNGIPEVDVILKYTPTQKIPEKIFDSQEELGIMGDYLKMYMTPKGFDLPSLLDDDYFLAIKILFNEEYYISCMKLVVSFVDTMAFLEFGDTQGNFIRWLYDYTDLSAISIKSSQLWELRNSILHMSNLDSRKVLAGMEKRIGFCVAAPGSTIPATDTIQYFNLIDLINVLGLGVSNWIKSINENRHKFITLIERYDRILSDTRVAQIMPTSI